MLKDPLNWKASGACQYNSELCHLVSELAICTKFTQTTLFLFVHEVPSEPRQLTVTDKQIQSVHLKWQKPSNPNGVIAKYDIIVVQGGGIDPSNYDSNMLVANKSVSGSISAFTVTELTELTRYSVWTVAVNIRRTDKAKLTSPPSQVITFNTKGGGQCKEHSMFFILLLFVFV